MIKPLPKNGASLGATMNYPKQALVGTFGPQTPAPPAAPSVIPMNSGNTPKEYEVRKHVCQLPSC
jgi:hypothetical protein